MGTYRTTKGASVTQTESGIGFEETKTISFGRTFGKKPNVSVGIVEFIREQQSSDQKWGLKAEIKQTSITTSAFNVYIKGYSTLISSFTISWIACE